MVDERIKTLQISALSRINFCFKELKNSPPLKWINDVVDEGSLELSIQNYKNLTRAEQASFKKTLYEFLDRESTTEARTMLIINYLSALLIEGRNNQISIHKNFGNKMQEIRNFETENEDIFVVRKSYKTKKAQDLVGLVLFLLLYLVFCAPRGIFEFRSCILPCFSKNRT